MAYIFVLLATLISIGLVDAVNYCQICTNHTMCLYNSTSSTCNKVLSNGVTSAEKAIILDEHNKCRQKVAKGEETRGNPGPQPPAANMRQLTWDDECAEIANMWLRQCTFAHDQCRNTNGTYVGQNLYMYGTTGTLSAPNWPSAIKAWYEEVTQQNRSKIKPFDFTYDSGHYTALAWGNTSKVGCAFISYSKEGWNNTIYGCNYSPGGNIIGTEMYKVGTACTACPGSCSTRYNGLCV